MLILLLEPKAQKLLECNMIYILADLDEIERQRQDRNDIRYLHLLRTLIHNEVIFVDPDLREEGQDPALFRMLVNFVMG